MENEYRISLERFEEMDKRYEKIVKTRASGDNVPEEELVVFLLDLEKTWKFAFALEQRDMFFDLARQVGNYLEGCRMEENRKSVYAHKYIGIFGDEVGKDGIMRKIMKGKFDIEDRPVMTLEEVRGMADYLDGKF